MLNISSYSTSESSNNSSKRSTEFAISIFSLVLLFVLSRETWNVMAWDGFAQQTGKYRSIRHMEYPKFQTRICGWMESAHGQKGIPSGKHEKLFKNEPINPEEGKEEKDCQKEKLLQAWLEHHHGNVILNCFDWDGSPQIKTSQAVNQSFVSRNINNKTNVSVSSWRHCQGKMKITMMEWQWRHEDTETSVCIVNFCLA